LLIEQPGQVLLGLGLATLVPSNGNAVVEVSNSAIGARVAGLLLQAGLVSKGGPTSTLLLWGSDGDGALF
jgi:hypothetical protein